MDWERGAARRVENSSIRLSCEEQDRCLQFCEQIPCFLLFVLFLIEPGQASSQRAARAISISPAGQS